MRKILFAERLKELRKEENLTQVDLAKATGLSQSAITAWEVGTNSPTATAIVLLAEYFDVTTDYILGISDFKKF